MQKQLLPASLLMLALALGIGAWTGYVDQHNDEVWAALIILLPSTFVLGFLQPRYAWLWALAVGSGVPAAGLIGLWIGHVPPCHPGLTCPPPSLGGALQGFIALLPASCGAYAGAGLRWLTALLRGTGATIR